MTPGSPRSTRPPSAGCCRRWCDRDRAGRIEDAERWVARTEGHAARAGLPASATRAARGRVEILLARGEAEPAEALAGAGAEAAAAAALRQEELELRLLPGRALLAAGRREEAVATLQAVAAEGGAAKAVALEEEAARELRRAGSERGGSPRAVDTPQHGEAPGRPPGTPEGAGWPPGTLEPGTPAALRRPARRAPPERLRG